MNDHERLKKKMSTIFTRKGKNGNYTRLFDNLEPDQQRALLGNVRLSDGELPIIGSLETSEKWLLVTTRRIVWNLGKKTQSLPLEAIRDVVADFRKMVRDGITKDQLRELQVLAMNGKPHILELEPGAPLIGTWNALKNIGAVNRRRQPSHRRR